ncbi:hypothetical protein Hanom_Chr05g00439451 [Helianthus anomalus]
MEGPIITEILEEEGNVIKKGNDFLEKIDNNLDGAAGVDEVSNTIIRRPNKEDINFGCNRIILSKKEGKKSKKKKDRGGMGLFQDKMLSVDSRPSLRKRPRLDFDPNGLDPFGLDALLGLINNTPVGCGDTNGVDKDTSKEDESTEEGPAVQYSADEQTISLKSV